MDPIKAKITQINEGQLNEGPMGRALQKVAIALLGFTALGVTLTVLGEKISDLGAATQNQYGLDVKHRHLVTILNPMERGHPAEYGRIEVELQGKGNMGQVEAISGSEFVPLFKYNNEIVFVSDVGQTGKKVMVTNAKTGEKKVVAAYALQPFLKPMMNADTEAALGPTNDAGPQLQ